VALLRAVSARGVGPPQMELRTSTQPVPPYAQPDPACEALVSSLGRPEGALLDESKQNSGIT
jgi:hypothetical protein